MEIKAVLFDMDGVLIDTEDLILEAAIRALKEFGVNAVPEDFKEFVGAGENKFVGGPAIKHGVDFVPEMKDRTYEIYWELLKDKPERVYNGVLDVINYVKDRYRCAVCSAADLTKVRHNLRAIGIDESFFGAVITGSDIEKLKPNPDIFFAGAKKLGVNPENCVVIEDSLNGIRAAKTAGMTSVAVMTYFDKETLKKEVNPDYIIKDIRFFPDVLEKI
ncbi:MAG: HAD-IA family hydrolase [Ruminococcus sp.]|nr:HAD-IA family hydrolase [Candidatus Copronaster equi]